MSITLAERRKRKEATKRLGHYVYFFGWLYVPVPVFHRQGRHAPVIGGPRDGEYESKTVCGLTTYRSHTGMPSHVTCMPAFHAEKFGKPCRRCFSDLSATKGTAVSS